MGKYKFTDKMREISGLGGCYEHTCRLMVIAGMSWWDENPSAQPRFKQFKNFYGITTDENKDVQKMNSAMIAAANNDCTGAMLQVTTNHVLYAHKNGWDKYVEEMEKFKEDEQKSK